MSMRRPSLILLALGLALQFCPLVQPAEVTKTATSTKSAELMKQYLGMKLTPDRTARLAILDQLGKASDALDVIQKTWSTITDPKQRAEVAETVGRHIQTPAGAAVLTKWLKDPDATVRWNALPGLRAMASRTDRIGLTRIQRGPDKPSKVAGLVPALIKAANDSVARVRVGALFALADTREPQAVQEIHKHLNDANAEVRLHAACFLTEYQDASGLAEMLRVLERLRVPEPNYYEAYMLWASLERITGRSMGEIPMIPALSSSHDTSLLRAGYKNGLDAWHTFFESAEGKQLIQKLTVNSH